METTRLSSKGQAILPKSIRITPRWEPGVELSVEDVAEGVLLRPIKFQQTTRLEKVVSCIPYNGPAKTMEEMDAAIAAGIRERRPT